MRTTITRTITTTTIRTALVDFQNGQLSYRGLEPITINGTISKEQATKIAQKKHKGLNAIVLEIIQNDVLYEMDIDDFVKHARVVEKDD